MGINEISAANRLAKFTDVNLISESPIAFLKMTKNSYYKIFINEITDNASIGTTIIEILNNKIYSVCTPEKKSRYIWIDKNDFLCISGFEGSASNIMIDFFEEFEFMPNSTISIPENTEVYSTDRSFLLSNRSFSSGFYCKRNES